MEALIIVIRAFFIYIGLSYLILVYMTLITIFSPLVIKTFDIFMIKRLAYTFFLFFIGLSCLSAQEEPVLTLDNQFGKMITDSETYKEFRVIKQTNLYRMKRSVKDSLNAVKATLATSLAKEKTQNEEIERLNGMLAETNENLETVSNSKNSIDFLGIQMTKTAYKTMMWSIMGGLLALLLYFIYSYTRSNASTTNTKNRLDKVMSEFEAYKKRTLDKEQQIMRRLQDELNRR